ncbi:MAG: hypothetical protein ABIR76_07600 [Polaromonas sp.]
MNRTVTLLALLGLLGGCASHEAMNAVDLEQGRLPSPDLSLNIPGLGPCTDNPDRTLRINTSQPVHILVHGCFGSSGQFRGLAQVLAFHGQQSACFTYDDRARLNEGADQLRHAVSQLAAQSRVPQVTVIGHSQGALIARRSMTEPPSTAPSGRAVDVRLVTISGPFAGIESAKTCGKTWLYPLTLGMLPLSCYVATGPKWADITYSSPFIREPGALAQQVANYLKIDTNERGTCRREEGGRCAEGDDIFSLAEQHNTFIETDTRARRVEVDAGHVEIVGDKRVAPTKLIKILQDEGILEATPPARQYALGLLLSRVYQDNTALPPDAMKTRALP